MAKNLTADNILNESDDSSNSSFSDKEKNKPQKVVKPS
jgi:hypothetical protein